MKTVTIPTIGSDPYKVTINNVMYSYPAGATVSVPDEVAEAINNAVRLFPVENPPKDGDVYTWENNAGVWKKYDPMTDITVDAAPTDGSGNPVSSGGVYTAIGAVRQLPAVTISDAGKILKVNASGEWEAAEVEILSAADVADIVASIQ